MQGGYILTPFSLQCNFFVKSLPLYKRSLRVGVRVGGDLVGFFPNALAFLRWTRCHANASYNIRECTSICIETRQHWQSLSQVSSRKHRTLCVSGVSTTPQDRSRLIEQDTETHTGEPNSHERMNYKMRITTTYIMVHSLMHAI